MPPKPKPTGPFVVVNPGRKVPRGRFYIRNVAKAPCDCEKKCGRQHHRETGRWYEGDIYDGDSVEHWLERGFIKPGKGGK